MGKQKFYAGNCEKFHYPIVMAFFLFMAAGFELMKQTMKRKCLFFYIGFIFANRLFFSENDLND